MQHVERVRRRTAGVSLFFLYLALFGHIPSLAQPAKDPEQYFRGASTMHGKTVLLPIGTTLEGRIDTTIGSQASKMGQKFSVIMATPVLANGTDVVIPSGSQILGEVVEAIPGGSLPHIKGYPKPTGKLRVQLSGLRTPDGVMYPMVASLAGETSPLGTKQMANQNLGGGVGYVGTEAGFEAVAPGMAERFRRGPGGAPKVVGRQEMQRDALYGVDSMEKMQTMMNKRTIRSLQKRGQDIFILDGSPVSIRIDAPFKIGIAAAPGAESNYIPILDPAGTGTGRRFQPAAAPPAPAAPAPPQEQPFQLPPPQSNSIFPLPAAAPNVIPPANNAPAPNVIPQNSTPQYAAPPQNSAPQYAPPQSAAPPAQGAPAAPQTVPVQQAAPGSTF